jgi:formate dehydrogenase iron-sulfur subunit
MKPQLFVSRDAGALALGADEVERAIIAAERRRGLDIEIIRTGSRGLFWLEPMVEIATAEGRIAYGPVQAADIEALFDAGLLEGGPHPLRLGRPEDLPFLKRQTRLTFARCGIVDRLSLDDYRAHGGYRGRTAGGHRRGRDLGPARPRRRRISDRHQMAHHRTSRSAAEIYRLQCR